MPADLSLPQWMSLDTRVSKKRCAERPRPELCHAAPRAAEVFRIEHRMREHDRHIVTAEIHLPHEDERPTTVREHEAFVTVGPAQSLKENLHAYVAALRCDARGERASIREPSPVLTGSSRRGLPITVTDSVIHGTR